MNFKEIDVHTLLPQQEPFVMIHQLISYDEVRTVTSFTVTEDHLYYEDGTLNAYALIENIAQTCAARMGYINQYINNEKVSIGFIGAVRNLEISALPRTGQTIRTTVEVVEEVFGMTLAHASVTCEGETLVTTEMKIALKEG